MSEECDRIGVIGESDSIHAERRLVDPGPTRWILPFDRKPDLHLAYHGHGSRQV